MELQLELRAGDFVRAETAMGEDVIVWLGDLSEEGAPFGFEELADRVGDMVTRFYFVWSAVGVRHSDPEDADHVRAWRLFDDAESAEQYVREELALDRDEAVQFAEESVA